MKVEQGIRQPLPRKLTVGEFVQTRSCLLVTPKTPLYDVVNAMREDHSYAALVMDNFKLTGLLTEHRTLLYLLSWLASPNKSAERVTKAFNVLMASDVMIKYPETLPSDMLIEEAFEKIMDRGFRYMPVMKHKKPVGILNRSDITHYFQEQNRKELESKDMMLSYLMHHENYGCL